MLAVQFSNKYVVSYNMNNNTIDVGLAEFNVTSDMAGDGINPDDDIKKRP